MTIKIHCKAFIFSLLFFIQDVFAQDFAPLSTGPQQETIHFAHQLDDQIVALHSFDSHLRISKELKYDSLLKVMPLVNSVFSSLVLFNQHIHPLNELVFPSTKDSIFIYQNFIVNELDSATQSKEIILFGILLTPAVKTRVAVWLDVNLKEKRKIIYDSKLFFYIKNNGVSAHFTVNQAGNLMTNINGSTVELNNAGEVVKQSKYLLGQNYFQNNNLNYISPFPNGLSISDHTLKFIEFREIKYPDYPNLHPVNHKFIINLKDNYILFHSLTFLDFDCNNGKSRNAIIKYNTNTYEAEIFYIDSLDNCKRRTEIPDFSIDSFTEDYIYICRKYESCGFINLDWFTGENICNIEFVEVQCIDQNGQLRWRKELGADASYLPKGIVATPDSGCVVFTNRYERGVNTGRESDLYYTKLDKNGHIVKPVPVSVNETTNTQTDQIFIYPNPVKNILYVNHPTKNSIKSIWIEIYNLHGQLVISQKVSNKTINVTHLTKGMYTYTLKQNGQILKSDKLLKFE